MVSRKQRSHSLDELILRIRAAPLESELLPSTLSGVCDLIDADSATGTRCCARTGKLAWFAAVRYDTTAPEEHQEHWASRDEWLPGALRRRRVGVRGW